MKSFIISVSASFFIVSASLAGVKGLSTYVNPENGNTSQISIYECDDALCGKVESIVNKDGKDITKQVKKDNHKLNGKILWNLKPNDEGKLEGRGYSATEDSEYNVYEMRSEGDKILFQGCMDSLGLLCRDVEFTKKIEH